MTFGKELTLYPTTKFRSSGIKEKFDRAAIPESCFTPLHYQPNALLLSHAGTPLPQENEVYLFTKQQNFGPVQVQSICR